MEKADLYINMSWRNIVHLFEYAEYRLANPGLAQAILGLPATAIMRRSHFFHGRYENLYLDAETLPGLRPILATGLAQSAELLQQPADGLRLGFWLNIMHQGDITTLHSHDDDDELLSAVYYVQAPVNAGLFRLHFDTAVHEIEPVAGRFMFFDPAIPHEVTEHQSGLPRISIGFNIGPA